MKNTLLVAAACLLFQNLFAQATEVKNLHYKFHESSYNRKGKLVEHEHELNFNTQGDTLLAEKTKGDKAYPIHIFDFAKQAVIIILHNRKDYIVDEIDSSFRFEQKLFPTGRTEQIDGYSCSEYVIDTNTKISYHQNEGEYNVDMREYAAKYSYKVWITEELTFNPKHSPYVMALLKFDHGNIVSNFRGVVVRIEATLTYGKKEWKHVTTLDKDKLNVEKQVPAMPWLAAEPGAAMLPAPSAGEINSDLGIIDSLDEPRKKRVARMEEFLYKIVGHKNVRTNGMFFFGSWW